MPLKGGMDNITPKILCVDDENLNRAILRDALVPQGYEVVEAINGLEALTILNRERIDIVLLDINMPEMDGLTACRHIKSGENTSHIPVIMITSLTDTENRIRGIEAGAEDYITKPFNEGEVLARIRMLLKVKVLNDKLRDAYHSIKSLTTFGESVIHTFQPTNFNLLATIDSIVGQLLRTDVTQMTRPEIIVLGVEEGDRCSFYRYTHDGGNVVKEFMNLTQNSCIPQEVGSHSDPVHYFNENELGESSFGEFALRLQDSGIPVRNMVTYVSRDLALFSLNYIADVTPYEAAVLESLVMQTLFLKSLSEQVSETEDAFTYTVYSLARAAEARDHDTGDHILRVGEYCSTLATKLKMPRRFIDDIRVQSTLHDIGKLHTSSNILQKPGRLNKMEWEEMKKHTLYGARIIGNHRRFEMGKVISMTHHEKWDGTGYPRGLSGNRIPPEGRIVALADTYDALRTERVYKAAMDHQTACRIILEGDDRTEPGHFDPEIISVFRKNMGLFEEIFEKTEN